MKAIIIYKDFASAVKANSVLLGSAQKPDLRVQWDIRPWRVDMLKFPPIAKKRLADAIDAHLIVFVGQCIQSFSFWLQDWLEDWARRRQIENAALAVMPGENADGISEQVIHELSQFAEKHGLSFIIADGTEAADGKPMPDWNLLMPPADPGFIINPPRQDSFRDWGIND
jgi:hypothetical protein